MKAEKFVTLPLGTIEREREEWFYLGVLAALDNVIAGHDEPVIAADIIRAVGPAQLWRVATKRSNPYPFLKQLRKVYRGERLLIRSPSTGAKGK